MTPSKTTAITASTVRVLRDYANAIKLETHPPKDVLLDWLEFRNAVTPRQIYDKYLIFRGTEQQKDRANKSMISASVAMMHPSMIRDHEDDVIVLGSLFLAAGYSISLLAFGNLGSGHPMTVELAVHDVFSDSKRGSSTNSFRCSPPELSAGNVYLGTTYIAPYQPMRHVAAEPTTVTDGPPSPPVATDTAQRIRDLENEVKSWSNSDSRLRHELKRSLAVCDRLKRVIGLLTEDWIAKTTKEQP